MARKTESSPLLFNLSEELRDRLKKQADRFGSTESVLIRMALTKWLEEEENIQEGRKKEKIKLIPKTTIL